MNYEKRALILGGYNTANHGMTLSDLSVGQPEVQESVLKVPQLDGVLDFSDKPSGRPIYGQRTITAKLECSQGSRNDREKLFDDFTRRLHGRRVDICTPETVACHYEGRIKVKTRKNLPTYGWIEITASCDPWLYSDVPHTAEIQSIRKEEDALYAKTFSLLPDYSTTEEATHGGAGVVFNHSFTHDGARGTVAVWGVQLAPDTGYVVSGRQISGQGTWSVSTDPADSLGTRGLIHTDDTGMLYLRMEKFSDESMQLLPLVATPLDALTAIDLGDCPQQVKFEISGDGLSVTESTFMFTVDGDGSVYANTFSDFVFLTPGLHFFGFYSVVDRPPVKICWRKGVL